MSIHSNSDEDSETVGHFEFSTLNQRHTHFQARFTLKVAPATIPQERTGWINL